MCGSNMLFPLPSWQTIVDNCSLLQALHPSFKTVLGVIYLKLSRLLFSDVHFGLMQGFVVDAGREPGPSAIGFGSSHNAHSTAADPHLHDPVAVRHQQCGPAQRTTGS